MPKYLIQLLLTLGLLAGMPSPAGAEEFLVHPGKENKVVFVSKASMESFEGKTNKLEGRIDLDPANLDAADHHLMFAGQEDDFGANYLRRYKFVPPPGDPIDPSGDPTGGGGGGGGSGSSHCGMGHATVGAGLGSLLALLEAGVGVLLLALWPGLGRNRRLKARRR